MSVRPSASRTEEGARETGKGLVARTWRRSKAVGEGSVGSRGLRSGSVRKAAAKVESISAGRRGGVHLKNLWLSARVWRVVPP